MLKWWKSKQMIQEMLSFKQTWNYCVDMSSAKWWWWPLVFRSGQVRDLWEVNIEPLSIWRREAGCQPGLQSGFFALTNWFSSEWCKVSVTNTCLANAYRYRRGNLSPKLQHKNMVIMKGECIPTLTHKISDNFDGAEYPWRKLFVFISFILQLNECQRVTLVSKANSDASQHLLTKKQDFYKDAAAKKRQLNN